jgi:hypothetical protein
MLLNFSEQATELALIATADLSDSVSFFKSI